MDVSEVQVAFPLHLLPYILMLLSLMPLVSSCCVTLLDRPPQPPGSVPQPPFLPSLRLAGVGEGQAQEPRAGAGLRRAQ